MRLPFPLVGTRPAPCAPALPLVLVRVPAHDPSFPSEAVVSPLLLLLLLLLLRCCCGGVVVVVVVSDSVAVVIAAAEVRWAGGSSRGDLLKTERNNVQLLPY